jgi:hypothetical protein
MASWNFERVSPSIRSWALKLAPSFWQTARMACSTTLARTSSVLPMLATIDGASAGVRPQTTVTSASIW